MTKIKQIVVGVDGSEEQSSGSAVGLRGGRAPWCLAHRGRDLAPADIAVGSGVRGADASGGL